MAKGKIHSFETFGAADGPGVRFMVFLSGCPLRCAYCHNPDTWARPAAMEMEAEEVLEKALRYRSYWGEEGGITVSGGEPLLQLDFLIDLFTRAKAQGVSTCIDTSAAPFTREGEWFGKFERLMKVTDLLLLDIKAYDSTLHEEITGKANGNILDCAKYLSQIGKPVWIRHVFVPGFTEKGGDTEKMADFLKTLGNVKRIDVLPYHVFGVEKWKALGLDYALEGVEPPKPEETAKIRLALDRKGQFSV